MNKRILIVDDEDDILNLVRLILEDAGYECETARNGKEGLSAIQQQNFDLVLLDIMMPVLTGWEVLRFLRDNEQTRNLPVAMLTARAFSAASEARRWISSGEGRLASTSAGINPSSASFTRHFFRSSSALSGLRSLEKRDLAARLRSLSLE